MNTSIARLLRIILATSAVGLLSLGLACGGDDDDESVDDPTATEESAESTGDSDGSGDDGGDDGDDTGASPELEDYYAEIEVIFEDADAQSDELEGLFDEAYSQAETIDEAKELLGSYLLDTRAINSDAVDDFADVEPPDEVEDAHNAFLEAANDLLKLSEDLFDALQDVETEADLDALSVDFEEEGSAAAAAADEACFDLQDIADEAGVVVDLDCED